MPLSRSAKGKKRASEEQLNDVLSSPDSHGSRDSLPPTQPPAKKQKRAETKVCPVCEESIPVRLLGKHSDLEMARVQEIIQHIGSMEVLADAEPDDGLTSRSRRSTVKVRKSVTTSRSGSTFATTSEVTIEQIAKTVRTIRNHRKQRHAKLRELTREDEDAVWWKRQRAGTREEDTGTSCPVCGQSVKGDIDVVEAHVDSCIAHMRITEEQNRWGDRGRMDMDEDIDVDGEYVVESVTAGVNFRGTGFDIPDRNQRDIEDDIDVDGEDEVLYGAAQFTENDIHALADNMQDGRSEDGEEVDVDLRDAKGISGGESSSLGAHLGKTADAQNVVRRSMEVMQNVKRAMEAVMDAGEASAVDSAAEEARRNGNAAALVKALENKISLLTAARVSPSTSLMCRICLDPYTEPTVSTGCWHTCCRECWLRCLGSTKMCPICKRITAAADLRRLYL